MVKINQPIIWCPFLPNQICIRACYLPLLHLSTNQKIQLIHSQPIKIKWPTGN